MADNFSTFTVEPFIPKSAVTDTQLAELRAAGFDWEEAAYGELYFFAEGGINGFDENDRLVDSLGVFQQIVKTAHLKELIVQGSWWCSKARPGEFGGWVCRITPKKIKSYSTYDMLDLLRKKKR